MGVEVLTVVYLLFAFLSQFFYRFQLAFVGVILNNALRGPRIYHTMFRLAKSFVKGRLSLAFPPFCVPTTGRFMYLPLTSRFEVVLINFRLPSGSKK